MAGVHQMMLHRVPSGGAFPTYFGTAIGNPNSKQRTISKNNSLSTMAANSLTSPGSVTISGSTWSGTASGGRVGTIFASGNVVFTDTAISTNGGATFPTSIPNTILLNNSAFTSGRNGSYAYNPTTNRFVVYYTQLQKSGSYDVLITSYNASTGSSVGGATGGSVASNRSADQLVYSPTRDRYYVFAQVGSGTTCTAHTFNGSTGSYENTYSPAFDFETYKAGISANGNVIAFAQTSGSTRELREYTVNNFTSYNSLGTVSGLSPGPNGRYTTLTYLPVNQRYAVVSWSTASPTLYFNSSALATPNQFTAVALSLGVSLSQVYTGNIFEDTNGHIYLCFFLVFIANKSAYTNSVTFVSTNGGASFTLTMADREFLGLLAITRNLL